MRTLAVTGLTALGIGLLNANEPNRSLRSLDAIHLATARVLGAELDAVVTYDDRMSAAAVEAGMSALSPGARE